MIFNYCPKCGSKLGFREEEGRRAFCLKCHFVHYRNPLPCVAALVRNSKNEVLLVKRGVEPGKGEWALPAGFIEIDETPEGACLRELREETGLEGEIVRLVGVFPQESSRYEKVLIIAYEVKARGELKPGSDSEEVAFFPFHSLPEIAFSSHMKIIRKGVWSRDE